MRVSNSLMALMLGIGMYFVGPIVTKFEPFTATLAHAGEDGTGGGDSDGDGGNSGGDGGDGGNDGQGHDDGGQDDNNDDQNDDANDDSAEARL